jgi:hypothetical protein
LPVKPARASATPPDRNFQPHAVIVTAVTSLLVILGTPIVLALMCGLTVWFPVRVRSTSESS